METIELNNKMESLRQEIHDYLTGIAKAHGNLFDFAKDTNYENPDNEIWPTVKVEHEIGGAPCFIPYQVNGFDCIDGHLSFDVYDSIGEVESDIPFVGIDLDELYTIVEFING